MKIIKGNYDEVKQQILEEYKNSDQSICEWFSSVICEDLSIDENVKLYAELRDQCDGDITCNIIDQDSVILLSSGNNCTLREVIKLVEDM